jgi:hypothetical protein
LQDNAGSTQIAELYQRMSSLAPETQMFMLGCTPELEAKYNRIQARGLVMRNLFAFAAGVQKTLYWQLLDIRTNRHDDAHVRQNRIVGPRKRRTPKTLSDRRRVSTHVKGAHRSP